MKRISWLSFLVFLAMACQDDRIVPQEERETASTKSLQKARSSSNARGLTDSGVGCGEVKNYPLIANNIQVGTVQVAVNESGITAYYNLSAGEWFLLDTKVFAGDCNAIPDPSNFPYQDAFDFENEIKSHVVVIPWDNIPSCGCLEALAVVARYNSRTSVIESFNTQASTDYCDCEEPEQPTDSLACDESIVIPVTANHNQEGTVTISLNDSTIEISYDVSASEWFLMEVNASAGACTDPPTGVSYSMSFSMDSETRSHHFALPLLTELPECGCLQTSVTLARFNSVTSQIETRTSTANATYCKCDEPEEPNDKNLRTQTPGGWGAPPSGDNAGAYLHENFASAFPGGLVAGCNYTITLTSAQAVTNFLPQGGTPGPLTKSYLNPVRFPKNANNPKNVLASHVVALKLAVTFDAWDEDFGGSNTDLADAVVASGAFEGWTVAQVLAEGEKILGGCASDYRAAEITDVLSQINESFVDGTTNTGFLTTN